MKNRKGFTLIELLVAITIIGIIMLMVLPAVHNLQKENQEKKFADYERTVLEAAKAYEDQYEEDLYGRNKDGCASIKFSSLVNTKLLATTTIAGYECNYASNQNGVIIRKVNGTPYYEVYLTCSKGIETKNLTTNTTFATDSSDLFCKAGEDKEVPIFNIDCGDINVTGNQIGIKADDDNIKKDAAGKEILYYSAPTDNNNKQETLPNLNTSAMDDKSGLEKNQYITYEWKISERSDTGVVYNEKNKSTYNTKDGTNAKVQKKIRIIEPIKKKDTTGKAEIYVTGENIVDRAGNKLDSTDAGANKTCTYYYDNAKPIMKITVTGENTGTNYNQITENWINEPVTIKVEVTDKTSDNNIYVGVDTNTLTVNGSPLSLSEKDASGKHVYELTGQTNRIINEEYVVCDKLKNCESSELQIKIDTTPPTCNITGDGIWKPEGAYVTMNCTDPTVNGTSSGVQSCNGSPTSPYVGNIKSNVTWTVVDNARNSSTCSYNVQSKRQYYQVNCNQGNTCEAAGCARTERRCEERIGCKYRGYYDSGGRCEPQGHAGPGTLCDTCHYQECTNVCVAYKESISLCGCHTWNSTGTWKDSSCASNNCKVTNERMVYK